MRGQEVKKGNTAEIWKVRVDFLQRKYEGIGQPNDFAIVYKPSHAV